jgi:uncharacterized membrane protein YgcG
VRPIRLALALALLVTALPAAVALALTVPPAPTRRINDYAGALSLAERDRLEAKLAERERTSQNQVVVAIFRSLEGESLEDFSIRLAERWKIGQKGLDNGVILLVFLDDRKLRLEVGYGLEPTLTDAVTSTIINTVIVPRFRERQMAAGIEAGLDAIDAAIRGEFRAEARREPRRHHNRPPAFIPPERRVRPPSWLDRRLPRMGRPVLWGWRLRRRWLLGWRLLRRRLRRRGWVLRRRRL